MTSLVSSSSGARPSIAANTVLTLSKRPSGAVRAIPTRASSNAARKLASLRASSPSIDRRCSSSASNSSVGTAPCVARRRCLTPNSPNSAAPGSIAHSDPEREQLRPANTGCASLPTAESRRLGGYAEDNPRQERDPP